MSWKQNLSVGSRVRIIKAETLCCGKCNNECCERTVGTEGIIVEIETRDEERIGEHRIYIVGHKNKNCCGRSAECLELIGD